MRRLGYTLTRAQHAFHAAMRVALHPFELTAPQYVALAWIRSDPGIPNAALARAVFVSPQTMQEIIAKLEKRGLLKRTPDPDHGRKLLTNLLPKGRKILERAEVEVAQIEKAISAALGPKEVEHLTSALGSCADLISTIDFLKAAERK